MDSISNSDTWVLERVTRVVESLPDRFFASGSSSSAPVVRLESSSAILQLPDEVDALREVCTIGSVGHGRETLVDTKVRRVRESSKVHIEWAGLQSALDEATRELCPNLELKARFYKLLLYEPGDFFRYHFDSKMEEDHMLTLVVDCGSHGHCAPDSGGVVCFRKAHSCSLDDTNGTAENPDAHDEWFHECFNDGDIWYARDIGDWCCWFASQQHRTTPINEGCRIVAVYNVLAYSHGVSDVETCRGTGAEATDATSVGIPLPIALVQKVVSLVGARETYRLGLTCKSAQTQLGQTVPLLSLMLGQDSLLREVQLHGVRRLGFLLHHWYSFDGCESVPLHYLRGRDRLLHEAVKSLGWSSRIVACHVVTEATFNADTDSHSIAKARISSGKGPPFPCSFTAETGVPADQQQYAGTQTLSSLEAAFLHGTEIELDQDDVGHTLWPFRDLLWMTSPAYLRDHFSDPGWQDGEVDALWGNSATFSIYWYLQAALIADVFPEATSRTGAFARDIPCWSPNEYWNPDPGRGWRSWDPSAH